MYISKITLKNIRGFESLEFNLDRGKGEFAGWTVFTGSNGSGKSTLLKAIAFCLLPINARFRLQPNFEYFQRKNSISPDKRIELVFSRCQADDSEPDTRSSRRAGYTEVVSFIESGGMSVDGIFVEQDLPTPKKEPPKPLVGWFACGYGPLRRITSPNPNVEEVMRTKNTERFATLFLEAATLAEVDPWLTKLKFEELEKSTGAANQLAFFLDLIQDSFLPDGYTVDRVDSKGLWLRDPHGIELSWNEMSDGQRVALALTADVIRHMIGTYGIDGLYERDKDGKIYIKRSGVVLIDEIDAHLHPAWQREIGFWLKRHFPNVQFLVTSHSPIIVQAADPNGLFVLPEPGSEDEPRALTPEEYLKVITSRPDTILRSPAFGNMPNTRSEPMVEKRARYSRLQAKKRAGGKLSAAEAHELMDLLPFVSTDEGE